MVEARLTDGREVYPHRPDLWGLPFWKCDACGHHVGCHHKSRDRTRPLGSIPTGAVRGARRRLHDLIDPLWRSGKWDRSSLYREIARRLGLEEYHTARVDSVAEADRVIAVLDELMAADDPEIPLEEMA